MKLFRTCRVEASARELDGIDAEHVDKPSSFDVHVTGGCGDADVRFLPTGVGTPWDGFQKCNHRDLCSNPLMGR